MPSGKTSVHLRIDSDVFEWFKKQGEGHHNAYERGFAVLRGCEKTLTLAGPPASDLMRQPAVSSP
jgi:hypothetical protein